MKISVGESTYTIDDLGFLSCKINKENHQIDNIYLIAFKEHSIIDPTCPHLDNSSKIGAVFQDGCDITYNKMFENFSSSSSITFHENGFDWDIWFPKDRPTFHRFGMSIPCGEEIFHLDEKITNPIVNYYRTKHRIYRDQKAISLPILSDSEFVYYSPDFYDVQFFQYKEGESPRLRITALTSNTGSLKLSVRFNISDEAICQWAFAAKNDPYEDISKRYGVEVNQDNSVHTLLNAAKPTAKQLAEFAPILREELSKYKNDIFQQLGIMTVALYGKIHSDDPSATLGFNSVNWLSVSVLNHDLARKAVHHEIFHSIQSKLKYELGFDYDVFVSSYADTNKSEYQCELFSRIMLGEKLKDDHPLCSNFKIMKEYIASFLSDETGREQANKQSDSVISIRKDSVTSRSLFDKTNEGDLVLSHWNDDIIAAVTRAL